MDLWNFKGILTPAIGSCLGGPVLLSLDIPGLGPIGLGALCCGAPEGRGGI